MFLAFTPYLLASAPPLPLLYSDDDLLNAEFLAEEGIDSINLILDAVLRTTATILKIEEQRSAVV